MSIEDEALREVEVAELRAALRREQAARAKAQAKVEELVEAVYQAAKDAALVVGRPGPVARPPRDRRSGEEYALLHLTDWQLGKVTQSYSIEKAEQRVAQAVDKAIRITQVQRADHPVRVCVLMLGGDLIEGVQIFAGQAWEVEGSQFHQVFRAAAVVERSILSLLASFDKVVVHEVWGNHGRLGRRGEVPREDNLDRMVGVIARERLRNVDRLEWEDPQPAWHRIVPVGDYRALLWHGDAVRSWGGQLPAYGIAKKVTSWASGVTEPFDDSYCGHFHQEMTLTLPNGGRIFVTPSTESGSQFAAEFVAAKGRPGQRLHFVHPKKRMVTGSYVLWLD